MSTTTQYVGIVVEGIVTDTRAVSIEDTEDAAREQAQAEARKLNSETTGYDLSWTAIVLPVQS